MSILETSKDLKKFTLSKHLATLFRHFGFIAPKTLTYLAFQSFDFEQHT
jgi:hypothetical protein